MKYIEPNMEVLFLEMSNIVLTSLTGNGTNIDKEDVYEDDGDEW